MCQHQDVLFCNWCQDGNSVNLGFQVGNSVLELGEWQSNFKPSSSTGSSSSRTGHPILSQCQFGNMGVPVPKLEHPRSKIGTVPKWGTQCWNWMIQCQNWAWHYFAIHAVLKLGDQFRNWMPSSRTRFTTLKPKSALFPSSSSSKMGHPDIATRTSKRVAIV